MISLFYAVLFLAAGSNASPCKPKSSGTISVSPTVAASSGSSSVSSAVPASSGPSSVSPPVPASSGSSSGTAANHVASGQNNLNSLPLYPNITLSLPSSSSAPAPAAGGGSCPQGFINTVFNTGAGKLGGWPSTTWSSLSGNGVNQWSKRRLSEYIE